MLYLAHLIHFFLVNLDAHFSKRHSLFRSHYLAPRPSLSYPWSQDTSWNRNDLFSGRKGNNQMSVFISCAWNYTIGLRGGFLLAYYYFIIILKIIIWSHNTCSLGCHLKLWWQSWHPRCQQSCTSVHSFLPSSNLCKGPMFFIVCLFFFCCYCFVFSFD